MKINYKNDFKLGSEEERHYKLSALIFEILEENEVTNFETIDLFSSMMGFMRSELEKEDRDKFDRRMDERVYKYYSFFKNMQGDDDK